MFWFAIPVVVGLVAQVIAAQQEAQARAEAQRRRRAVEWEYQHREAELRRQAQARQDALRHQQQRDTLVAAARARAAAHRLQVELRRDQATVERHAREAHRLAQDLEAELPRTSDPAQREAVAEALRVTRGLVANTSTARGELEREGSALKRTQREIDAGVTGQSPRRLPRR